MRFLLMMGFVFIFSAHYAEQVPDKEVKKALEKKVYYDASRHITFLDQKFTQCQNTLKELQSKKKDIKAVLTTLGATLGQCRNFQILFSHHIKSEKKVQSVRLMKLLAAQNLFETYLIYQILGLDKDEDAKLFARTLELKLMKILPTFRPPILKN